jgi:hypothetical protein
MYNGVKCAETIIRNRENIMSHKGLLQPFWFNNITNA